MLSSGRLNLGKTSPVSRRDHQRSSLSPSINPGCSTQGFAESHPRQLAPSVGRTFAGSRFRRLRSTSTISSRAADSIYSIARPAHPRSAIGHQQRRRPTSTTAAAFRASVRSNQSATDRIAGRATEQITKLLDPHKILKPDRGNQT